MTNNSGLDYPAIQQRIEKQLQKEKLQMQVLFFLISLAMYIGLLAVGWGIFLSNGGQLPSANIPGVARAANPLGDAMMLLSVAGFLPLVMQLTVLIMATRRGEKQLRERVTGRIMQAEMAKQMAAEQELAEKPKRAMRLTDDGELEEVDDPSPEHIRQTQRQSNDH